MNPSQHSLVTEANTSAWPQADLGRIIRQVGMNPLQQVEFEGRRS